MLNKNQSKKWQSWKYLLIIPALAAFMFYFQVNVIAQEKSNPDRVSSFDDFRDDIVIDKNTTDAQMKEQSEMAQSKYGIKLKFSKVKRNKSNEIIGFKAEYKDKDNHKGSYVISGSEPIKPMRISISDNGTVAFGNPKQIRIMKHDGNGKNLTETITHIDGSEDKDMDFTVEVPEPPMPPDAITEDLEETGNGKYSIIKHFKNKNRKKLLINGETIDVEIPDSMNWEEVLAELNAGIIEEMQQESIRPRIEQARRDLEQAKLDLEQAKLDFEQSKRELEKSRNELEASKRNSSSKKQG